MNVHDVKEKNRSVRISKAQKAYAHRHMRTTKCSSWRYDSICSDLMDMCLLLFWNSYNGRFHKILTQNGYIVISYRYFKSIFYKRHKDIDYHARLFNFYHVSKIVSVKQYRYLPSAFNRLKMHMNTLRVVAGIYHLVQLH